MTKTKTYTVSIYRTREIQLKLEELYNEIPEGTGLLDTVREIVELEILLEKENNA